MSHPKDTNFQLLPMCQVLGESASCTRFYERVELATDLGVDPSTSWSPLGHGASLGWPPTWSRSQYLLVTIGPWRQSGLATDLGVDPSTSWSPLGHGASLGWPPTWSRSQYLLVTIGPRRQSGLATDLESIPVPPGQHWAMAPVWVGHRPGVDPSTSWSPLGHGASLGWPPTWSRSQYLLVTIGPWRQSGLATDLESIPVPPGHHWAMAPVWVGHRPGVDPSTSWSPLGHGASLGWPPTWSRSQYLLVNIGPWRQSGLATDLESIPVPPGHHWAMAPVWVGHRPGVDPSTSWSPLGHGASLGWPPTWSRSQYLLVTIGPWRQSGLATDLESIPVPPGHHWAMAPVWVGHRPGVDPSTSWSPLGHGASLGWPPTWSRSQYLLVTHGASGPWRQYLLVTIGPWRQSGLATDLESIPVPPGHHWAMAPVWVGHRPGVDPSTSWSPLGHGASLGWPPTWSRSQYLLVTIMRFSHNAIFYPAQLWLFLRVHQVDMC